MTGSRSAGRADCDLSLSRRYLRTMQSQQNISKQWHVRSLEGTSETLYSNESSWTYMHILGAIGLLCISCDLPLGIVKNCSIGALPILIRDWIYVPADSDAADAKGLMLAICDQDLAPAQLEGLLVLETSLLVQRAIARACPLSLAELPYHVRCAMLTLMVGRALEPETGPPLWTSLLHLSGILLDKRKPPMAANFSLSNGEAEIRGVLGVASWPITLFTGEAASRLLVPARLKLSNVDEDGEVLFALTVKIPEESLGAMPLLLLATDGVYSVRKVD